MADYAHKQTDKEILALERKLAREYRRAFSDMTVKHREFLADYEKGLQNMTAALDAGEIDAAAFKKWLQGQAVMNKRMATMIDSLAADFVNVDRSAVAIINGELPATYANNFNWSTYQIEKSSKLNTSFTLKDKNTVKRLFEKDRKLLPVIKNKDGKDLVWSKKHVSGAIRQGILQGESIDKIAKRLKRALNMNYRSAVKNARTAMTAAQNAGRLDSYERAQELGIQGTKRWLATMDDRTRDEHVLLDGEPAEIDAPFVVDGYEIMYPGDPEAAPEMVYNCRCTMIYEFHGTKFDTAERFTRFEDKSYEEWKAEHRK